MRNVEPRPGPQAYLCKSSIYSYTSCFLAQWVIYQYINVDSVRACVRHGCDAISFPRFELRTYTGYVNGMRASRIFRRVQLTLSASSHSDQHELKTATFVAILNLRAR